MASNEEGIARVTFRVRCDSLGHGESVYLAREDDSSRVSNMSHAIISLDTLIGSALLLHVFERT
jgi:hypothetical protein